MQRDHSTHRNLKPDHGGLCQRSEVEERNSTAMFINDSTVDLFNDDRRFDNVAGMENIAFIGFTTVGDGLGGFYTVAVKKRESSVQRSNHVRVLFRVVLAVHGASAVCCVGVSEGRCIRSILEE